VEPQPSNLVKPWKQVLALPDLGKGAQTDSPAGIGAVLLFWNPEDGSIQQSDPRPDEDTDPLPPGWDRVSAAVGPRTLAACYAISWRLVVGLLHRSSPKTASKPLLRPVIDGGFFGGRGWGCCVCEGRRMITTATNTSST